MFLPLTPRMGTGKVTKRPHVQLHPYPAEAESIRWAGGMPSVRVLLPVLRGLRVLGSRKENSPVTVAVASSLCPALLRPDPSRMPPTQGKGSSRPRYYPPCLCLSSPL